jgi:hypothetical protein
MNLSETDFMLFKKWLKGHLRIGSVTVTFTKKDGTERVMKCTTDPTIIMFKDPSSVESKGSTRKINEDILPVFDLEANTWKSFRWDSIKQVRFEL